MIDSVKLRNLGRAAADLVTGSDSVSGFEGGNKDQVQIPNTVLNAKLAEYLMDSFDTKELTSEIDAVRGVTALQQTSYDVYAEPLNLIKYAQRHTEEKYDFKPCVLNFNTSGAVSINGTAGLNRVDIDMKSGEGALANFAGNFYGHLLYVRPADTEIGQTLVSVENAETGFEAQYQLDERSGFILVQNHARDFKLGVACAANVDEATNVSSLVYSAATTNIADSYYLDFQTPNNITIKGTNAIVIAYPITLSRTLVEALVEAIYSDALPQFNDAIIEGFANQVR